MRYMSYHDKEQFLDNCEESIEFIMENRTILLLLAKDCDDWIRSRVASFLVCFSDKRVEKCLLKLSKDKHSFVRTEAYDSLGEFTSKRVEKRLRKAIINEKNELACFYAILSWVDVVVSRSEICYLNYLFIDSMEKEFHKMGYMHCVFGCYYGRYCFNDHEVWKEVVRFVNHDNYLVRCVAIDLLIEMMNNENRDSIQTIMMNVLENDNSIAVKEKVRELFDKN